MKLFEKYNLTSKDYFQHAQGWTIVTRTGIEKIQAAEDYRVTYQVIKMDPEFAVVKAIVAKGISPDMADAETPVLETFGSAKKGGYSDGTTQSWYVAEMAEKRALARGVLKLSGLYSFGVFSEEEAEEFKDDRKDITSDVINRANNAILRGEKTADEVIKDLEDRNYIVAETFKYNWKKLKTKEELVETI